jgi:hypothetical protein
MPSTRQDRLDGISTSVAVKAPVKAVTIAPLTLQGEQTVNTVALVTGDRVLVKDQAAASENGIYDVDTSDWSRSLDFNGNRDVRKGTLVSVTDDPSSVQATFYQVTSDDVIEIGVDDIDWEIVSTAVATYDLTGGEASCGIGAGDIDTRYQEGDIRRYKADPTGGTDSAAAIQVWLNYWVCAETLHAFMPQGGRFRTDSALTAAFTAADIYGKKLSCHGGEIFSNSAGGALLTISTTDTLEGVTIEDLSLRNASGDTDALVIDGNDESSGDFLYGLTLRNVKTPDHFGNGIRLTQNVFEVNLIGCQTRANSGNTTGVGILCIDGTAGGVRDINLTDCRTEGGLHGVHVVSPVSRVSIHGGSFKGAQNEGIHIEAAVTFLASAPYVEDNWLSAANQAAAGAGLKLVGSGTLIEVGGTTGTQQKYVVDVDVTTAQRPVNIIGGVKEGTLVKYAALTGSAGTHVNIMSAEIDYDLTGSDLAVYRQPFGHTNQKTLDNTGTPTVQGATLLATGGTTEITDFLNAIPGQPLHIEFGHVVTIAVSGNINLKGAVDLVGAVGDTLTLITFDGTVWEEMSRKLVAGSSATNVSVIDAAGDTSTSVALTGDPTGVQPVLTDSGITYNADTEELTVMGGVIANTNPGESVMYFLGE